MPCSAAHLDGLVSFALRGNVGVVYFATDVEATKTVLRQAGVEYVEKATDYLAPGVFHATRILAVAAAAGIGGLLLGALLFSRR